MQINTSSKRDWLLGLSLTVLTGTFCLQYYVDFSNLLKRWSSQDSSYCYLVPFIFLYLVYTNRQSLRKTELSPSVLGVVILSFSGVLYLGGKAGSIETLTYMAIWLTVVGLALLMLGTKMVKALAFPLLMLAFMVPVPPFLNRLFTFKLKLLASSLSVKIMQLGGLSVFREGNVIDLGLIQLQVVDACSGLRYVYAMVLMGLVIAYIFHRNRWERVLLVLATIPISVVANALRIAVTGFLAAKVSLRAAESFFHGFSGWLIFMVSLAFLMMLSLLLRAKKLGIKKEQLGEAEDGNPDSRHNDSGNIRKSYLWVASGLFLIFWGLNGALASAQMQPQRTTFEEFPTRIGEWLGEKTVLRAEILASLSADDYVQLRFRHQGTGDVLLLFVPYYEYQGTRHTAHSPVSCLVGGGFALRSRKIIERNFPEPFGEVRIRQMVLEKNTQLLLSNYWFHQRGRIISSEYWNKWYLFWDSVSRRRTDGGLVRLEMVVREGQDVKGAQAMMDSFTLEALKILPQYVPG